MAADLHLRFCYLQYIAYIVGNQIQKKTNKCGYSSCNRMEVIDNF